MLHKFLISFLLLFYQ